MALGAALFLTCTACGQSDTRLKEEGRSSVELYLNFTQQLRSGELHKTHIGVDSWYSAVTSQSEIVRFDTREDGEHRLLYRSRTPFVFWYFPPYDYYDGEQYFYQYMGNWFLDNTGKFSNVKSQDFLGLQDSFLTDNEVYADAVYQEGQGYTLETTIQSLDHQRYYTLTGYTDLSFQFSKIDIEAYQYDFDKQEYAMTDRYYFRYKDVNLDLPVERPADLDPANVVNQVLAQAQ